jgi:hypothetical protein
VSKPAARFAARPQRAPGYRPCGDQFELSYIL